MSNRQTLSVEATVHGKLFTHSKFVALKTKDAIVDQFRDNTGERPSIDTEFPDLRVHIHISEKTCDVSIDSSGDPLGKRGYRKQQVLAPMSENLAAGIILMSNWDQKTNLIDPMCGSGTFPIEAAMIAANVAPGLTRSFAFERWNNFDAKLWQSLKEEAKAKRTTPEVNIIGSDTDQEAIEISKKNAKEANVEDFIHFKRADFFETNYLDTPSIIFMNPPYGERLTMDEINAAYKEIGTQLKHKYQGEAWVISSNMEALKQLGLKPSKKIPLFNGALECKLHKYELYQGSRRPVMSDENKQSIN